MHKEKKKFITNSLVFSFMTLLSRVSGFVRDAIIAKFLGASDFTDALFAAMKIPNSFRRLLADGAMSSSFVPIFSGMVAKEGRKNAILFARNVFTVLSFVSILLLILMEIFMPSIIHVISPGFSEIEGKLELAVSLSRINFIFLLTISLTALCGAILNSVGKFGYYGFVPVMLNLGIVIACLAFSDVDNKRMTYIISYATVIIGTLQFILLFSVCAKKKMLLVPTFPKFDENVSKFLRNMVPGLIGSGVYQINILIDSIFASSFAGAVSYLYYTDRINQLPISLIGATFGVVLLPTMSKYLRLGDQRNYHDIQIFATRIAIILTLPCSFAMYFMGLDISQIVYERGEFHHNDVIVIAKMMQIFAFGLPFVIMSKIYSSCFFAKGDTKTPMKIGILSLIINAVVNYASSEYIGMYCVMVATTASAIFNGLAHLFLMYRHKMLSISPVIFVNLLKVVISCGIMAIVYHYISDYLGDHIIGKIFAITVSSILYVFLIYITKCFTKSDFKAVK